MYEVLRKENSNIVYYVDVEKSTVVAVMEDANYSIWNEISEITAWDFVPLQEKRRIMGMMPTKLSAKAVCHENDEFNLELGMKIARVRLLKKYYRIFTKVCCEIESEMEKLLEPLDALTIKIMHQHQVFNNLAITVVPHKEETTEEN